LSDLIWYKLTFNFKFSNNLKNYVIPCLVWLHGRIEYTCTAWSKKTDPLISLCDNFCKCTPMLTIFLLLQQDIYKVSGFFTPLVVRPVALSPLAFSTPGSFALWLFRPLACLPPGSFAHCVWLIWLLACSPAGWFAPSPWMIRAHWIKVIQHRGLYIMFEFRLLMTCWLRVEREWIA